MYGRTVLAGAALGVACGAHAGAPQAQVFGTVDLALTHLRTAGGTSSGLAHSGGNISRFGLRGFEDLGSDFGTGFWLEAGYDPTNGNGVEPGGGLSFNRRATVSLTSPYGELRLGRDDSATFLSTLIFDPFLTNGVAGTNTFMMLASPIQISNAVSYFLPGNLGGFYGQAQYAWGPTTTPSSGSYKGGRFGYAKGGLNIAASGGYQDDDLLANLKLYNLAASYDFDTIKPSVIWAEERRGSQRIRGLQIGASMPFGAHLLRASIGGYGVSGASEADWWKVGVGYAYNFSKSTQFYAQYAYIDNDKGARRSISVLGLPAPPNAFGHNAQGYQVGLRKFF